MSATTRLYRPSDARAFHDLNIAWIEEHFEVEAKDRAMLEDPQRNVIDKGGRIIVAELDGAIVGCVALMAMSDGVVELAKMAVDPAHQGAGIGKAILAHADREAADMGASRIWLESNSVLAPAIGLYRACGYRDLAAGEFTPSPYSRCNIQMMKPL